jgi:Beta-lactamase enzyme family
MRKPTTVLLTCCFLVASASLGWTRSSDRSARAPSPVKRQVTWLVKASNHLPVPAGEVRAHLSKDLFEALGARQFNALLQRASGSTGLDLLGLRPFHLSPETAASGTLAGGGETHHLYIIVNDAERISHLFIQPVPASWNELDRRLQAIAPRVALHAAELTDGNCRKVHALNGARALPLASTFKLYVLGALGRAVRSGQLTWSERVPVRNEWRSVGPNPVDEAPAGREFTLRRLAELMISRSDNSATDHLIRTLGRAAVEDQQAIFGVRRPGANRPWLTTREVYQLKLTDYPRLAREYRALTRAERYDYLRQTVADLPLPSGIGDWNGPRAIDVAEWFTSAADLCRAYAGLAEQANTDGLEPAGTALAINDGGLGVPPSEWSEVWFKGGSEPGVLTFSYLARTDDGRTFVASALASNPRKSINDAVRFDEMIALLHGAFDLASGQ